MSRAAILELWHRLSLQNNTWFHDSSRLSVLFQVLAFFVYNFFTNFILEPTYQTCFNATLQKLKLDPRITVRLGNDIVGKDGSRNRAALLQCLVLSGMSSQEG